MIGTDNKLGNADMQCQSMSRKNLQKDNPLSAGFPYAAWVKSTKLERGQLKGINKSSENCLLSTDLA